MKRATLLANIPLVALVSTPVSDLFLPAATEVFELNVTFFVTESATS